ncbi:MAG: hypothetical protein ACK5LO_02805 [Leucobacter sp.]
MTEPALPYERIALADDLHLTWDRHLVTVATERWEPGVFVYDIEYLTVEVKPRRGATGVTLRSRGVNFHFRVLRFDLDETTFHRFEGFIGRVRAHRDRLREHS